MKHVEGGICAVRGIKANGIKQGKNGLAIMVADARRLVRLEFSRGIKLLPHLLLLRAKRF